MVHVLPQGIRHSSVPFIGVHHCREDILLTANDFHRRFVSIFIELFCEIVAVVIVEVCGVYIENQFAKLVGIGFQTTGGDRSFCYHLLKHFRVTGCRSFEMDVHQSSLRDYILIGIGFLFSFVMTLCFADICIS